MKREGFCGCQYINNADKTFIALTVLHVCAYVRKPRVRNNILRISAGVTECNPKFPLIARKFLMDEYLSSDAKFNKLLQLN